MPRRCQVESIVPRTFRSGLDVECGGGDIGTHPHAGAETDKERGGRATGSRQIPKEKHKQNPQTLPHHTTLDLSRVTRMNRLSPAVSCALWLEGESEKKQRRHSVFRYGLCPKLRYPSAGCVANAGLAGVAGRAGFVTPTSAHPAPFRGCFAGNDHHDSRTRGSLSRTTTWLASTRRHIHS